MPRKMSQRWLAANQENAQKSTGPKTPEGKARSAQNACKHGLLARQVVIPEVDGPAAEFDEFLETLHAQFRPQGAVEHALLDRVAACYWRLRRAQRCEAAAVAELAADDGAEPGPNTEQVLGKLDRLQSELRRDQRDLQLLQTPAERLHEVSEPYAKRRQNLLTDASVALGRPVSDWTDPAVLSSAVESAKRRIDAAQDEIRHCESQTEAARQADHRLQASRRLLTALPRNDHLDRLIRYENMLDRQLHRALRELRRRRTRSAQSDVEPPPQGDGKSEPARNPEVGHEA